MRFWFGRKSAPEVRPFVPVWLQGDTESGGFVRGYHGQLDEVYRRNPVGLRAVRLVAGLTGSLPLFAEEGGEEAVELVRSGGLMERIAAALLLHGNAYVRLVADGHDRPAELHCMRPERMSVATGADGWPAAYLYRAGGEVTRIAKEDALGRRQVAHLKALDPGDDHYGLKRIGTLLCPVVEGAPQAAPPASPAVGECYLVAAGGTGDWLGKDSSIACFTAGGWRFVEPIEGLTVTDGVSGETRQWRSGIWEEGIGRVKEVRVAGQTVLRGRQPAISNPVGGGVVDSENRVVVTAILGALRTHGLIG